LLLGDEQESEIDKYLERGEFFALYDGVLKSVCTMTDEGGGVIEIQNLATDVKYQKQGYASDSLNMFAIITRDDIKVILGKGDVPGILSFYKKRGFAVTHRVPDYFTNHYDKPIIEDGVMLKIRYILKGY